MNFKSTVRLGKSIAMVVKLLKRPVFDSAATEFRLRAGIA